MHRNFPPRRRAGRAARRTLLYLLLILLLLALSAAGKSACPICGGPVYFAFFRFCGCLW